MSSTGPEGEGLCGRGCLSSSLDWMYTVALCPAYPRLCPGPSAGHTAVPQRKVVNTRVYQFSLVSIEHYRKFRDLTQHKCILAVLESETSLAGVDRDVSGTEFLLEAWGGLFPGLVQLLEAPPVLCPRPLPIAERNSPLSQLSDPGPPASLF